MSTPDQRLMDLGQKIIEYRNNADIKQEAFAKELGISRTTLSFIENGSQAPSFEVLVKLAQITNINFNELIDVKSKNIVVVDTNILLNRPEMLGVLLKDCDQVYIPIPVIEEINYQKDHGKEKERRNASLCEDIIVKKKTEKLDIHTDSDIDGSNDDKILDIAIKLAEKDISNSVYLLTNDKDFILKNTKGLTNLRIIGSNQYIKIFSEKDGYNDALSQRFFVAVLKRDLDSAKNLLEKKGKSINVNAIDSRSGYTPLIQALVKHQEVEVVEQLLTANGIPYVYYDYGKLINEGEINKIDGIRLVFLDIRLEDGNEEAKNIYSVLASTIETIIGVNNGPYTIVLWTNEYQLKDEVEDFLMKRLSDEDTTRPTYICALDKKDFLEKPESLFGRVNDELNKNRPLEFLTTLESMTMEIPLSLLKMLLYETGNGIDPSSINKLLMLLASVESTDEIDNVKATKNILSVIADLVKDRYLDLTSNNNRISELAEYMDVLPTFDPNNVSIEVKARLNTAFNINTHGSENEKLPGKVYKTNQIDDLDSFDKSTFGKKGKQLVLTKKDKKVVVVYDLIKVDITPGCDYAQDKAFISTYAYGYLIHIYKFEDEKGNKEWLEWKYAGMISDAGGVYFTPYFLNGDELCMLLVNTKWIRFEKYEVNEDNYLFRLNDSLTSDIRKSASDNIARVGIPCV